MKRLSDMLAGALDRPDLVRSGRAQFVARDWPEVVGDLLAQHTTPDRYEQGTLWIAASGSAWAQELRLRKDLVISRLNQRAGEPGLFRDIRVGVRPPRRGDES